MGCRPSPAYRLVAGGVCRDSRTAFIVNVERIRRSGTSRNICSVSRPLGPVRWVKRGLVLVLCSGLKIVWPDIGSMADFQLGFAGGDRRRPWFSIMLSLAFLKSSERGNAPRLAATIGLLPRLGGGLCLLLSVTILFAAGTAHELVPLASLAQVPAELLYQSAACYAICGVLLIRASAAHRQG